MFVVLMAITLAAATAAVTTALGTASSANGVLTAFYSVINALDTYETSKEICEDLRREAYTSATLLAEPSRAEYLTHPPIEAQMRVCIKVITSAVVWIDKFEHHRTALKKFCKASLYEKRFAYHQNRVTTSILLFVSLCTMHSLRTPKLVTGSSDMSDLDIPIVTVNPMYSTVNASTPIAYQ